MSFSDPMHISRIKSASPQLLPITSSSPIKSTPPSKGRASAASSPPNSPTPTLQFMRSNSDKTLPVLPPLDSASIYSQPSPVSPRSSPTQPATVNKRQRCIQELVSTEASYAQDLRVIVHICLALAKGATIPHLQVELSAVFAHSTLVKPSPAIGNSSRPLSIARHDTQSSSSSGGSHRSPSLLDENDIKTIFLNVCEIADFSNAFVGLLDNAAGATEGAGTDDHIGELFCQMSPRLHTLYEFYVSRHDSALHRLEQLEQQDNMLWQEYARQVRTLSQGLTTSWNLNALLIKPIQRCLKYPLLLDSIIQRTDDNHPDLPRLKEAYISMTDIAKRLNEARRARELVSKIVAKKQKSFFRTGRRSSEQDLSKALKPLAARSNTLTMTATVARSFNRSGQRLRAAAGFRPTHRSSSLDSALLEDLILRFDTQERALSQFSISVQRWATKLDGWLLASSELLRTWTTIYQPTEADAETAGGSFDLLVDFSQQIYHCKTGPAQVLRFFVSTELEPAISKILRTFANPRAVIEKRRRRQVDALVQTDKRASSLSNDQIELLALSATLAQELPEYLVVISAAADQITAAWAHAQSQAFKGIAHILSTFQSRQFNLLEDVSVVTQWQTASAPMLKFLDELTITSSDRLHDQMNAQLITLQLSRYKRSTRPATPAEEYYSDYFASPPESPPVVPPRRSHNNLKGVSDVQSILSRRNHLGLPADDDKRVSMASSLSYFSFASRNSTVPSSIIEDDFDALPSRFSAVAITDYQPSISHSDGVNLMPLKIGQEVEVLLDNLHVQDQEYYMVRINGKYGYIPQNLVVNMK